MSKTDDTPAVIDPVEPQDTTPADPAPAENNEPEVADDSLLDVLSSDDDNPVIESTPPKEEESPEEPESKEETPDPEKKVDEPKEEEQPLGEEEKPLSPKAENRFQRLANENRELKEQLTQIHNQVYGPPTAAELEEEGLSPEMAHVQALEKRLEVQEYTNKVYESQMGLSNESAQVIQDFPIFDPDSPNFDPDIAASAAVALEKVLIRDPNVAEIDPATGRPTGLGQIIGSHASPYEIYKPIADAYAKSQLAGEIKGRKAADQMLSQVDTPPSATPKETKKDPLSEILKSDD